MGRLLLLSMFFVGLSIQAQECSDPIAGRTSHIYLCSGSDPVNLQALIWPITTGDNAGKTSDPNGVFVGDPFGDGSHEIDPSQYSLGRHKFEYMVTNTCSESDDTIVYVYILETPYAGEPGSREIAHDGGIVNLSSFLAEGVTSGGVWKDEGGNELIAGDFDPTVHQEGSYTYSVSKTYPGTGPNNNTQYTTCESSATWEITISKPAGDESEMVLICHKGKTLEVHQDALAAHLGHGDVPGSCGDSSKTVVHPNPSRGDFNFINSAAVIQNVRIVDFNGNTVKQYETSGAVKEVNIDLGNLRKGVYFAEVSTSNGMEVHRLIKK